MIYVQGIDQATGFATPFWCVAARRWNDLTPDYETVYATTHCGKEVRVLMHSEDYPGDKETCPECVRVRDSHILAGTIASIND